MTAPDQDAALAGLSGLAFTKGHATGNDFVLVADPQGQLEFSPEQVRVLCDRHLGVGADGLIRAVPTRLIYDGRESLEADPRAEWFMDYRNADGSVAQMCGNGVRAFVRFLEQEGLAQIPASGLPIGTRAGVKIVTRAGDGFSVDMGPWDFTDPSRAESDAMDSTVLTRGLGPARPSLSVDMGNPHTVVALAGARELEDADLTVPPEVDPIPPQGVNVEYVVPSEPLVQDRIAAIEMRVHERGVGETLSCGTGACAAVVATRHWAGTVGHDAAAWAVQVPGGVVGVRFTDEGDGREHVHLSGPALMVYSGQILA